MSSDDNLAAVVFGFGLGLYTFFRGFRIFRKYKVDVFYFVENREKVDQDLRKRARWAVLAGAGLALLCLAISV